MKDLSELNHLRDRDFESQLYGYSGPKIDPLAGIFFIRVKTSRRPLKVIVSSALHPNSAGWDHVSVSLPARCPTWDEMDLVKRTFFHPHEACFQLHPAESEHISNHPYCLHIWHNALQPVPLPPAHFVGVKAAGEMPATMSYPEARRRILAVAAAAGMGVRA